MPLQPPSNPSSDTPGGPSKATSGFGTASRHATGDQAQDEAQDEAQTVRSHEDEAQFIRSRMNIPPNISYEELAAVLNLLRDERALDTLLVCLLMGTRGNFPVSSFSTSHQATIADLDKYLGGMSVGVIRARDSRHKSFEYSYIGTLLHIMNSTCALGTEHPYLDQASEIYAARARYLRWRQLENNHRRGVPGRDHNEDYSQAWAIFDETWHEILDFQIDE